MVAVDYQYHKYFHWVHSIFDSYFVELFLQAQSLEVPFNHPYKTGL